MTSVFLDRLGPSMTPLAFSRGQMVREATLTEADLAEVAKCRRDHNRLGFAYQVGFVRLFNRFPAQQPLEICDELLSFVATATGHRRDRYRRVRGPAAYRLGSPSAHSGIPQADRLRPWGSRCPGTLRLRGIVSPGADRLVARPSPRVPQGAARPLPRRVGAAAAGRGAEEAGPRTHRCQAGRGPFARRGEGPRRPAGGEGGGGDLRPPGDQGQPGQALGGRHAEPSPTSWPPSRPPASWPSISPG